MKKKILLISITTIIIFSLVNCMPNYCDGIASGKVVTWIDENKNGEYNDDEKPLARVKVGVGYPDTLTDENGLANISKFKPGCCSDCWKDENAVAEVPSGFSPTTPTSFSFTGSEETYYFGFVVDPNVPTPTQYTSKLLCISYQANNLHSIGTAPDGSLWVVSFDSISHFDRMNNQFTTNSIPRGYYDYMKIDEKNNIWLSSLMGINRYNNNNWYSYSEDSIVNGSIWSMGSTSDGTEWFLYPGNQHRFVSYNSNLNEWKLYVGKYETTSEKIKAQAFTNGILWFAAFGNNLQGNTINDNDEFVWNISELYDFTSSEFITTPIGGWIHGGIIDLKGTIWFSTGEKLIHYLPESTSWELIDFPNTEEMDPTSDITHIILGNDNSIWITSISYGKPVVIRYINNVDYPYWITYDERDINIQQNGFDLITITGDGKLWLGATYGNQLLQCEVLE